MHLYNLTRNASPAGHTSDQTTLMTIGHFPAESRSSFSGGIAEVVPKFECARLSTSVDLSSTCNDSCGMQLSSYHFSHNAPPPLAYKVVQHDEGTAKSALGFSSGIGGSVRYGLRTDGDGGNATQRLIEGELV